LRCRRPRPTRDVVQKPVPGTGRIRGRVRRGQGRPRISPRWAGNAVDELSLFWCRAWHRTWRMTRTASPKLCAYAGLSALGLLAALVLGRPELAVLATPFALLLFVGLASAREPDLDVVFELDRDRAIEGDELELALEIRAHSHIERLELHIRLPDTFEL